MLSKAWRLSLSSAAVVGITGVGVGLQQPLVGDQQVADLAALLRHAGADHVLHVLQRGVAFVLALGVGVVDQHQRVRVALLGGGHALLQHLDLRLVARRDALGVRIGHE